MGMQMRYDRIEHMLLRVSVALLLLPALLLPG
jgi:hypothetical protein